MRAPPEPPRDDPLSASPEAATRPCWPPRSAAGEGTGEAGRSRTIRALLEIRELILEGIFARGERISELAIAERTGISRTPIRTALQRLEGEGLVEAIPSGGYAVTSFTQEDVFDAIEIRGTLEGLAARRAAERGAPPGAHGTDPRVPRRA
jgi:GntR family transcriptional regulator, vanillate catabolism transcriptional regulator